MAGVNPNRLTVSIAFGALVALAVTVLFWAKSPDVQDLDGQDEQIGEWTSHGSDFANSKYAPLEQINAENFNTLKIAWRWKSIQARLSDNDPNLKGTGFRAVPLVAGGRMFVITSLGQIVALDPGTGETLWEFEPESYKAGHPVNFGFIHRGVSYWTDGVDSRVIFAAHDRKLWSLVAETGKPAPEFADGGPVDLESTLTGPFVPRSVTHNSPVGIARNTIIVGSSIHEGLLRRAAPGHIRGFDARTGEMKWIFHTIPQQGEVGVETWENDSWKYSGNANVWSMFAVDDELGYVYAPVSSPTNDFYGGHRLGDNLFGESLVCIDAETGDYVWHFQMVHHPLWDYDLSPAPNLVDIVVDGKPIKAVAQVSKQAFCYVFDRVTGEPVWPIVERPVPQSAVPGERTSPTQPFPTKPAPYDRQGFTEDDMVDFTPELRAMAVKSLEQFQKGEMFTPPTLGKGTIGLPGPSGGTNWRGAAFDPESGVLYVPSGTRMGFWGLTVPDPNRSDLRYTTLHFGEFDYGGIDGIPFMKPPYSRLTAIDLNSGEHLWMTPLGDGPIDHPMLKDLDLPPLGQVQGGNRAGPMVTKTLFFLTQEAAEIGSNADMTPRLSAFNKKTGELVGTIPLPSRVHSSPMTYMHNGKQYIAMAIGGKGPLDFKSKRATPEIVALSLP